MNKKVVWLITVVIIASIVVAFNYEWFYYRLYPFDRITGTYSITVNGESIYSSEQYFEHIPDEKIRLENDTKSFRIKDGPYGMCTIGFVVDADTLYKATGDENVKEYGDVDLSVNFFNTNWWHITVLDIKIDIFEEEDKWYAYYDIKWICPTENFEKIEHSFSKKAELGESTGIQIGP